MVELVFDLHLYLANWGTRCFYLRLPKKLVDSQLIDAFLGEVENATMRTAGDNLVVEISADELDVEDIDDGAGWLAALAPLRADILAGDLRMFYLLWLTAVQAEVFEPDEPEPMPGIGPLNASLNAFAEFFQIDANLVAAAAERSPIPPTADGLDSAARTVIRSLSEMERNEFLMRLYDGEPHVGAELRKRIRAGLAEQALVPPIEARTVGELRARAASIARERNHAAEAAAKADRERREKEQAENHRKRLDALAKRGESAWREVATEIERRNAASYDRAVKLIADLRDVALAAGKTAQFEQRVEAIRQKHVQKGRFIERLSRERFSAPSSRISGPS